MCGIIGFIGNDALNGILNGLELLEYRGYDSARFAIRRAGESQPEIHKMPGTCQRPAGDFSENR